MALEALLLKRFFRHDEILGAEAHLILRERKVIVVLRIFIRVLFTRANLPIFPFILVISCINGVFAVFGIVVHTVNVLGVAIKCIGRILDRGYEVGGGWESKFSAASPWFEPDIVRL